MAKVARGKALVAKLRAQAGVRNPEALAAWLGRFKKARKRGLSPAAAAKAANGGDSKSGSSKPGITNRGRKAPTIQGRKLTPAEKREADKRSEAAERKRFGSTVKERREATIAKARKDERAKEDEYHEKYKQFFAGTKESGRTMADNMPLRKGMQVQMADGTEDSMEVLRVLGPNEVEVRLPNGLRKRVARTDLLLTLPKHYRKKK
jgi:hypothetical protein